MNLFEQFQPAFSNRSSKVALRVAPGGQTLTFSELKALSGRLANTLIDWGVVPGDRVAVQVEKSAEAIALYLAVLRCGAVYLPLNTAYMPEEVEYFVRDAEPSVIVTSEVQVPTFEKAISAGLLEAGILTLEHNGTGSLMMSSGTKSSSFKTVPRKSDDIAAILYTSGTTGRPKGAMLTHGNLASNASVLSEYWGWKGDDVLLHALPIFHAHGLFVACNISFMNGTEMIFLPKFAVEDVLNELPASTTMMGVPTFYTRLLADARFNRELVNHMRLFISGSAPLLEETFGEFYERTGHFILERYGMTETGMNTSNPLDGERRPGTVGFPLPGTEIRVVDEEGVTVESGDIGSLQVRGANVFKGYWRMPEKTAAEFTQDGFFITGDLAKVDSRGYVSIVGREKDLIITGGYNVYPKEIELIINELDGVLESAVFGVKNLDFGEGVAAAIVKEKGCSVTDADIMKACEGRLARYKLPKQIFYMDELPRNAMGKVQKNLLRESFGG